MKTTQLAVQTRAERIFSQSLPVIIGRLSVMPFTEDQWQRFLD